MSYSKIQLFQKNCPFFPSPKLILENTTKVRMTDPLMTAVRESLSINVRNQKPMKLQVCH